MRVFVTWAVDARRSTELAKRFGARPVVICPNEASTVLGKGVRIAIAFVRTLRLFFRECPSLVFVPNQPLLLVVAAYVYGQLRGCPFVIDHDSGARGSRRIREASPVLRILSRHASLSLVTNQHHADLVRRAHGKVRVVADVPFEFADSRRPELSGEVTSGSPFRADEDSDVPADVVMPCTFARDEPLEAVLEAARTLPQVQFLITGDLRRADRRILVRAPMNVTFKDSLPDEEYLRELREARAVLALTRRNHTLQGRACEALSLGRPVITSDWPLLRQVFSQGAVYTKNDATSIAEAVVRTLEQSDLLADQALRLRAEHRSRFDCLAGELEEQLRLVESVPRLGIAT